MGHTLVFVYRPADGEDCSNRGLTSKITQGHLFWDCTRDAAIEWCKANNRKPEESFFFVERTLWGRQSNYAEPLVLPKGKFSQSFGGNFIYTSSGNFCSDAPIPVHDRFETWEEAEGLSI